MPYTSVEQRGFATETHALCSLHFWNSTLTPGLRLRPPPRPPPVILPSRRCREERLRLRHANESRISSAGPPPPLPPPTPPNPNGTGSDHAADRLSGAWQAGVVGVGVAAAAGSGGGSGPDEGRGRRGAGAAAAPQLEVGVGALRRLRVYVLAFSQSYLVSCFDIEPQVSPAHACLFVFFPLRDLCFVSLHPATPPARPIRLKGRRGAEIRRPARIGGGWGEGVEAREGGGQPRRPLSGHPSQ